MYVCMYMYVICVYIKELRGMAGAVCISGSSLVCDLNPSMYVNTEMKLEREYWCA